MRYKQAENWVFQKLNNELDDNLCYHDIKHTADVIRAADRLCFLEDVSHDDTILVRTAALFHDIGFCEQYVDNEDLAIETAEKTLPLFGYSAEGITQISGMIEATKIPHQPKNHLEEILCDADLDYLGRDDFQPISNNLRTELMRYQIIRTKEEWDEIQVRFFELHRYFTPSAKRLRSEKKATHLIQIRERLASYSK